MDEKIAGPDGTADAITQQLVQANKFDPAGLEANREGKISANQQRTIMEALGLGMALLFAIPGLVLACGIGFNSLNAENWLGAAIPIAIGVVLFGGIGYLILLTKRTGTDKYLTNRRDALPRLLLMGIDLIRSNVASAEGPVMPTHDVRETESRSDNGSTSTSRVDLYAYRVGGQEFYVEEEGYNAFSAPGLNCRLYYLPMSKALVNIEVLDRATLNARGPRDVDASAFNERLGTSPEKSRAS